MDDDQIKLVQTTSSDDSPFSPLSPRPESAHASPSLSIAKVHPQIWPPEPLAMPSRKSDPNHAGLEVEKPHSNLEVYAVHRPREETWAYYGDGNGHGNGVKSGFYSDVTEENEKQILGLKRQTFWFLVILAGIVVGAAVGGGVGGAMIGRERERERGRPQNADRPVPTGGDGDGTTTMISISISSTPSTTTTTGGLIPTFTPPSSLDIARIPLACPPSSAQNLSILTALPSLPVTSASFTCLPNTDLVDGDITGIQAFSLQQCIDACATMNQMVGMRRCLGVTIGEDVGRLYREHWGANCWLKGEGTRGVNGSEAVGFVSARVCVEGGCAGGAVFETVED